MTETCMYQTLQFALLVCDCTCHLNSCCLDKVLFYLNKMQIQIHLSYCTNSIIFPLENKIVVSTMCTYCLWKSMNLYFCCLTTNNTSHFHFLLKVLTRFCDWKEYKRGWVRMKTARKKLKCI